MNKDERTANYGGSSKLSLAKSEPPPNPDPAQFALMMSIGFSAASLAFLIYAACKLNYSSSKRDGYLVPQDQPVK